MITINNRQEARTDKNAELPFLQHLKCHKQLADNNLQHT